MKALPQAIVRDQIIEDSFTPAVPVMCVDWPNACCESTESVWHLPEGVKVVGPVPERFGMLIERAGQRFDVVVVWNNTRLHWSRLTLSQLVTSSLPPLLAVQGTSIERLIASSEMPASRAA